MASTGASAALTRRGFLVAPESLVLARFRAVHTRKGGTLVGWVCVDDELHATQGDPTIVTSREDLLTAYLDRVVRSEYAGEQGRERALAEALQTLGLQPGRRS